MNSEDVNWKGELDKMVDAATNAEDKSSLEAFRAALGPYLENPDMLRTLLGKIAQSGGGGGVAVMVGQNEYKSIEELKKTLPAGIDVFEL
ncbi:MAG TPA: hypothetical protein VM621_18900 [Luteibacter sp.]|uniref:hypothetical protein n=1 Tax=Luteibacter sp. TaxID=1886636 RepID=UPI002C0EE9EE|nr:hypothetical protein [Luteibacter sp.]HVI57117.1 hypothetical protein [Luteibacter sp.]